MRLLLALLAALVVVPSALGAAPKPGPNMPVDGGGQPPPPEMYAGSGLDYNAGWDISSSDARYASVGPVAAADYSEANYCCVPDGWYAFERCRFQRISFHAGLWPYQRRLYTDTFWCWIGNAITMRRSHAWPDSGPMCSPSGAPLIWRNGGGAGSSYVDVHAGQAFSCPSPVWAIVFHDTVWFDVRYMAGGYAYATGYGGGF